MYNRLFRHILYTFSRIFRDFYKLIVNEKNGPQLAHKKSTGCG
jgi:lysyl-tRNA synthetase class I